MFETLQKLLAKQLRIDESTVTLTSKIKDDLGADSIDILQLLMTMEEDYNITIPDEKLAEFKTVGDIVQYLDALKS